MKKKNWLAFVPAMCVIAVVTTTAAGISLIPSATAADVEVTGEVTAAVASEAIISGCGAGASGTIAFAADFKSSFQSTGDCVIEFGSTNATADLSFVTGNLGEDFFCYDDGSRACGTASVSNVADGDPIDTNSFGLALSNVGINAAVGADVTLNAGGVQANDWYGIDDTEKHLCSTSTFGNGRCTVRFGVQGAGASQLAGDYSGNVVFDAVAAS